MAIQAVIFDMDGVIVDSEAYWWQARVEFAATRLQTWTMDDQRLAMGHNTIEWGQIMVDRLAITDQSVESVMHDVTSRVIAKLEARLPVLPGAIEAIRLSAAHYPVGLASGSPTAVIQHVTRATGMDQVFGIMVYGDDMAHGKPAPDIYFEAARQLGVEPGACVGIEDSGNGLRSLRAAGMRAIAVPSPGFPLAPDVLALADLVLPTLESYLLDAFAAW